MLGGWENNPRLSYEQKAFKEKYNYYDMGNNFDNLNAKVSNAGFQINEEWLNQKIAQGKNFVLSKNPNGKIGDSYRKELIKLSENGYTISDKPDSQGLFHVTKGEK